jgi:Integral membrane protein possibly involved in chromosome condensation
MGTAIQSLAGTWFFPIGIFSVNMIGCLLIGFLGEIATFAGWFSPELRLLIFVGLLGGYTTFSSFGFDTMQLIRNGHYLHAALNVTLQPLLGVLFVFVGVCLARLVGAR